MSDFKEFEFESQASYTFLEEIGRGGMGIVYLAARNSGNVVDYVVLKTLKSLNESDERALRQEANLAAQLRHENIVKTYGLEYISLSTLPENFLRGLGALSYTNAAENSSPKVRRINFKNPKKDKENISKIQISNQGKSLLLLVMDYIDGASLHSFHYGHIEQGLLMPVSFGAFIISRIARALAYSHNYLIHRDISPENILLNTQGTCKLSDFGIAVATHQKPDYWAGKLGYMSPEQMMNEQVDERIDIFALGSVAYQVLTGIPLAEVKYDLPLNDQIFAILSQFQKGIIPPHKVRYDIPESLSNIVMKMLAILPAQRYQRASTIASDLEKKFLYAKGYGPTNNSLATYLSIYENKFSMYNEEQLEQLSFLKNERGEIQLKRELNLSGYTPEGLQLLESRAKDLVYQKLHASPSIVVPGVDVTNKEIRIAYLKVKYLDNVLESFQVQDKTIILGSGKDSNIILEDPTIDPQYCKIQKSQESVFLTMVSAGKEVVVNNKNVSEKELREGDKIKIGSHILFFLHQTSLETLNSNKIYNLSGNTNLNNLINARDFAVSLTGNPTNYTQLAKLCEQILGSTNLSELKLGVIPIALLESLQLLKIGSSDSTNFIVRFIRTPVRIIIVCSGFNILGYHTLLNIFRKHRALLAVALTEKEITNETRLDSNIAEDLLESSVSSSNDSKKEMKSPVQNNDSKLNFEDPDSFDPNMLAATMIVHGFDRIEFKADTMEVEFAIYL